MTSIHQMSALVPLPEFDLWAVPPTQISIDDMVEAEYRPITTTDEDSPIIFNFSTSPEEYVKLDDMYISWNAKFQLIKADKSKLSSTEFESCYFANYAMHAMLDQVDMEINNKKISNMPQNYPYRAYMEALLGYSKDAKKTHLTTARYDVFKQKLKADANREYSMKYNMMGKLHHDLAFQGKYLIGGCNMKIEMNLRPTKFYLTLPNDISAKLSLTNVKLFVKRAKVTPSLIDAHRRALDVSPVKYPITRTEVKHIVVPSGLLDVWVDNLIFGQIPRRMFVALVENSAFNGSYSKDPFKFEHFKCIQMAAFIDGICYPNIPYTPDFEGDEYSREYLGLFQSLNQDGTDSICDISLSDFKDNKCIFGFNFASDLSNGCGLVGHANPIKKGSLRLQIKFKDSLKEAINVLAFCEFDNIIEINKIGEVSVV